MSTSDPRDADTLDLDDELGAEKTDPAPPIPVTPESSETPPERWKREEKCQHCGGEFMRLLNRCAVCRAERDY